MGSTEGVAVMLVGWKKGKGSVGVLPCWGLGGKELPVLLPQALESGDGEHGGGCGVGGWEWGLLLLWDPPTGLCLPSSGDDRAGDTGQVLLDVWHSG